VLDQFTVLAGWEPSETRRLNDILKQATEPTTWPEPAQPGKPGHTHGCPDRPHDVPNRPKKYPAPTDSHPTLATDPRRAAHHTAAISQKPPSSAGS